MKIKIKMYGEEVEVEGHYEVCPRCNGNGQHCNPNIDGNGLSENHANDPEFMANYVAGAYDVTCEECHGERVIGIVADCSKMAQEYKEYFESGAEYEAICRAEMLAWG